MKVILLKDARGVGRKYETKEVGDGHAINMLIPKGLALPATPANVKRIDAIKAKDATMRQVDEELARKNIEELSKQTIEIAEKTNEQGHLFAGVHTKEIAEAIKKQIKLDIDPEWIKLEKPIKVTGEQDIDVEWNGIGGTFKLSIIAEK